MKAALYMLAGFSLCGAIDKFQAEPAIGCILFGAAICCIQLARAQKLDAAIAAPAPTVTEDARDAEWLEDAIESAYWEFDARHKGINKWKGRPQSERDAYKWSIRNLISSEADAEAFDRILKRAIESAAIAATERGEKG